MSLRNQCTDAIYTGPIDLFDIKCNYKFEKQLKNISTNHQCNKLNKQS